VAGSAAPPCVLHSCHCHGHIHKRQDVPGEDPTDEPESTQQRDTVAVPMGWHDDKAVIYVGHDDCCHDDCCCHHDDCCHHGHHHDHHCCHHDHHDCCHHGHHGGHHGHCCHHNGWGHDCHKPHVEYAGCDEDHGHVIRVCRDCINKPEQVEEKTERKVATEDKEGDKGDKEEEREVEEEEEDASGEEKKEEVDTEAQREEKPSTVSEEKQKKDENQESAEDTKTIKAKVEDKIPKLEENKVAEDKAGKKKDGQESDEVKKGKLMIKNFLMRPTPIDEYELVMSSMPDRLAEASLKILRDIGIKKR